MLGDPKDDAGGAIILDIVSIDIWSGQAGPLLDESRLNAG